ncbi:MAG: hypothetical protein NTX22_03225 [Ignavibacteriales bacterium]|nr:hypothetical protein [Ignavibacteriales bacterium]
MELIPILSFIILVATISTFILAIGAYVLYKIREGKGKLATAPKPRAVEGELYTPAQVVVRQGVPVQQRQQVFQDQFYQNVPYEQQARPGTQPGQQENVQQGEYRHGPQQRAPYPQQNQAEGEFDETPADKKFMKYTSEGYVPVNKTKTGENLKWR